MKTAKRITDALLLAPTVLALWAAIASGFTEEELPAASLPILGATAVVCFALTRTRPGTAALFLLGSFVCAGAYFLQFPIPLWSALLFAFSALSMLLLRCIARSASRADAVSGLGFGGFIQLMLFALLALALAAGIFFAVIRPLSPPTRELRLITELRRMELLQVLGVSRTELILEPDPGMEAELPPEEQLESGDPGEEERDALDDRQEEPEQSAPPEEAPAPPPEAAERVGYPLRTHRLWLLLLLSPLAIAAAVLAHALRRRSWERAVAALPPADAAVNYYRLLLRRLSKAGLRRTPRQTLREFSALHAERLAAFLPEDCGFEALTDAYERAYYGRGALTAAELEPLERTYAQWPRLARRELGAFRYALTAFRH